MKSAGNDIVALNAIDIQRTVSPAFYSKFILPAELELYRTTQADAIPFQNFVWLLWSVKESVYKYLKRHQPGLVFSPAKIVIQNIDFPIARSSLTTTVWESGSSNEEFYTGQVKSHSHLLYFRSKISNEYISSVVNNDPGFEGIYWGIKLIEESDHERQSKLTREFMLMKLKLVSGIDGLSVKNSPVGYPIIMQGTKQLDCAVSLAHHDHFVAYSFLKTWHIKPLIF